MIIGVDGEIICHILEMVFAAEPEPGWLAPRKYRMDE